MGMSEALEQRIFELGSEIFELSKKHQMGVFDKKFWSGKLMDWSMKNHEFKVEMFRFVDVLPMLESHEQISEHIKSYFLRSGIEVPGVMKTGMIAATSSGLTSKIAASTIRKNVTAMAKTFITGEDSKAAKDTLEKLWNQNIAFTVDILGELVVSEDEAVQYQQRYLELIEGLGEEVKSWKGSEQLEIADWGSVPRANVSVKLSALYSQLDPMALDSSVAAIKERVRPILRSAMRNGVFLNFDIENYEIRNVLYTLADEVFLEDEFKDYPHFGVVIQAYLKDSLSDVGRMIELSSKRGAPLTVRLVKGAYWDYEIIQARQRDWEIPVFLNKAQTDANYEMCAKKLLDAYPKINTALGSHNVRSLSASLAYAETKGIPKNAVEIQMLYGMAEPFKQALIQQGYRLRDYAPVGEMLPGMAYLVRRLLENTSNEGFLRSSLVENVDLKELLADPKDKIKEVNIDEMARSFSEDFKNEALLDFSNNATRLRAKESLQTIKTEFPFKVISKINGKDFSASVKEVETPSPFDFSIQVSKATYANEEIVEEAITSAQSGFKSWSQTPVDKRVEVLRNAAKIMQEDKARLSALITYEVSKDYKESDADVAEAIDFCNYYADLAEELFKGKTTSHLPGELNRYIHQAKGVCLTIAPWNFPLAILCGMTVAPLVCGNSVIMKPAEQSTAIAGELYKILMKAGAPKEALQFVVAEGETVGAALVADPRIHVITFTGSRAVGLQIIESAAKVQKGQRHIKRVIAEMGGKNALIIDDDADLDEAVLAAMQSAFKFQGQKCSALSRLVVLEPAYEKFKERFVEALKSIKIGPDTDFSSKVSAVIDEESKKRLESVIERNKSHVVYSHPIPEELKSCGHFVCPTVFESEDPCSELGQNEFFGPLVCLFRAKDLEDAVRIVNDVDYALTGGLISRNPESISFVKDRIEVGNFYINRGITGALVCRQPFGGYKLSGVGGKAGGPDYLLQYLEPRTITENTMRRGFAPEI